MSVFYNEIEPFAAEWMERLAKQGHIALGVVDRRSVRDVKPVDVKGAKQAHFFAGLGGWAYALRLAGWPEGAPVWTGSCPCQPFSAAGKKKGFNDERHLWPEWFRLIKKCRPPVIFGEQVANPDGLAWFDLVSTDLERAGYTVAAADLCAAGVGAPHIRQRLYFVAIADSERRNREYPLLRPVEKGTKATALFEVTRGGEVDDVAYAQRDERRQIGEIAVRSGSGSRTEGLEQRLERSGAVGVGNARSERLQERQIANDRRGIVRVERQTVTTPVDWRDCDWLPCRDGKYRPVEPGTFPLAHGVSNRVGRLRAYGNAIVPQVAAAFVKAVMDIL